MSLDPTNPPVPFPEPPSIGRSDAGGGMGAGDNTSGSIAPQHLSVENLLLAEFNYASTTAYQAMEDRARMFDRYLLIVGGVFVAGIGALKQLDDVGLASYKQPMAVFILFIAAVIGVGFFVSLVHLRQAWQDSAITMNTIKEYYIREYIHTLPTIDRALHWRLKTIPRGERIGSVTTTMSMTIAALGTLCWAIGTFLATQLILFGDTGKFPQLQGDPMLYVPAAAVALISIGLHWLVFHRALSQPRDKAIRRALDILNNSNSAKTLKLLEDLMGLDGEPVLKKPNKR